MRVRNRAQVPTKRTPTESAQHKEAWINWKRCTEISPREIRMDLHEFTGLGCNNWIFINLLLTSSWSWTPFPPYITWRVHRWTQRTTKGSETGRFSYPDSPYKLHTIVKLGTDSAVFRAPVPIPKSDEDCSVQNLRSLSPQSKQATNKTLILWMAEARAT